MNNPFNKEHEVIAAGTFHTMKGDSMMTDVIFVHKEAGAKKDAVRICKESDIPDFLTDAITVVGDNKLMLQCVEGNEFAKQVTMTEKEYQDLVNSYGEQTANQLIEQLSLYKQAKGTTYDNDYAAIIRWVTVRLHEMEKEKANYDKFKKNQNTNNKKSNFSQREYPPGFFDSLYANQQ